MSRSERIARHLYALSPGDFEALVLTLVKQRSPDAFRPETPDGGADVVVAGDRYRVWQAKLHKELKAESVERSFRTAAEKWAPLAEFTVAVPVRVTQPMRLRLRQLATSLQVPVHWWDIDELTDRILRLPGQLILDHLDDDVLHRLWPVLATAPAVPPSPVGPQLDRGGVMDQLPDAPGRPGPVALVGPRGVGKTYAARVWVEAADTKLWARGPSADTLAEDLRAFAPQLGIAVPPGTPPRAALSLVTGRLASTSRWRLVLDDVAEPDEAADLVAALGAGNVLITSNSMVGWSALGVRQVELPMPSRQAAKVWLHAELRDVDWAELDREVILDGVDFGADRDVRTSAADALTTLAGASPLVLRLIVDAVREGRSAAEFVPSLSAEIHRTDVLAGGDYPRSAAAAVRLSLAAAAARHPAARPVANLVSVLAAAPVPQRLWDLSAADAESKARAAEAYDPAAARARWHHERSELVPFVPPAGEAGPAARALRAYGLVEPAEVTSGVWVEQHSIVRTVVRDDLAPGQRATLVAAATLWLVALPVQLDVSPAGWYESAMLMRHAGALRRQLAACDPDGEAWQTRAWLASEEALFRRNVGELDRAEQLWAEALTLAEAAGPDAAGAHRARLMYLNNLGAVAAERGDFVTAIERHRNLLAERVAAQPPQPHAVARSRTNLAASLLDVVDVAADEAAAAGAVEIDVDRYLVEARDLALQAKTFREASAVADAAPDSARREAAWSKVAYARAVYAMGDERAAIVMLGEAHAELRAAGERDDELLISAVTRIRLMLGAADGEVADALHEAEELAGALPADHVLRAGLAAVTAARREAEGDFTAAADAWAEAVRIGELTYVPGALLIASWQRRRAAAVLSAESQPPTASPAS